MILAFAMYWTLVGIAFMLNPGAGVIGIALGLVLGAIFEDWIKGRADKARQDAIFLEREAIANYLFNKYDLSKGSNVSKAIRSGEYRGK